MSTLFHLVANQRTGTNYFRDRLNRDTNIHAMGEVFFPGDNSVCNFDGHFFEYFRARLAEDRKNIYITDTNVFDRVFGGYFEHVRMFSPRPYVCLDIKSDCFQVLPRLYEIIDDRNEKVIHIVRRDKLTRAVSQIVLNQRFNEERRYKLYGNSDTDVIELSYDEVKANILAADNFDRFIINRFNDGTRLTLIYEDLVANMDLWDRVLSFVGATGSFRAEHLSTQRKGLGSSDRVRNFEEIHSRLKEENLID